MAEHLIKNNKGIQILTDSGWSDFEGLIKKGIQETFTIVTKNTSLTATADHEIYTSNNSKLALKMLNLGDKILTKNGIESVIGIVNNNTQEVYDIYDVKKGNRFYANDMLVSNCEPVIYDETLISSLKLLMLEGVEPTQKQGQVRWWKTPTKGKIYVVALDPSLGTGGDYAALQVYELPEMLQVAEWMHNKTPIQQQVRILAEITRYISDTIEDQYNVYYSVENNTLGEAALVSISEIGEENISGIFLSEPYKPGNARRFRKGFNTTNKSKISACAKLKNLIESDRMTVNSKPLLSEFKHFVATGNSFAAKPGEHDDLVMSTLLAVRMSMTLQNYDPEIQKRLQDSIDDVIEPMPFIML